MRMRALAVSLLGLLAAGTAAAQVGGTVRGARRPAHTGPAPVVDVPSSADRDPNRDGRRRGIGRRFRFPGQGLEELPAGVEPGAVFTHELLGLPAFPLARSPIVVLGRVNGATAYLTPDGAGVYSEFTLDLEEVLRNDGSVVGSSIVAYRDGGSVRFPSGRIQHYRAYGVGLPRPGERYVLFLERRGEGADEPLRITTGYHLDRGVVDPLDDGNAFATYAGAGAAHFLTRLREAIVAAPGTP